MLYLFILYKSEQAGDLAVHVHVNIHGGGVLGQAGHRHDAAADNDHKARTGAQTHLAHIQREALGGTGQLGIEALSRGAAHCDFVEHNKAAYGIVSKNVESARVKDKAALHRTEAAEFVSKAGRERYDVIFLDPPYGGVILENALKQIETFDILSVNGIIICESAVEDRFSPGFAVVRERRYGATMITILQRQSGETE